ncbi:Uma2 family endonuclease [Actinoplanes sp. NPDC051861]|uniref:Uma2 family endonuclease n=1 Tax=Actinoplanes sp. NPDC051861 TaxID=3155170 RepID=UPI00343FD445
MSIDPLLDHSGPWTEEEFLALGETRNRIELIDGSLWVTPNADFPHQRISRRIAGMIDPEPHDLAVELLPTVNVRLAPNRIVSPDLAIGMFPEVCTIAEAADVLLACEITSPSNAAVDRVQKKDFYAAAKIPWYLLIEPDKKTYQSVTVCLLRLDGDKYIEHAIAGFGEILTSDLPYPIAIDTTMLLGIRPRPDCL